MKRRDYLSLALCVLALAISVLAIGGAMRWAQAIVAAVAVAAVGATVPSRRGFERWPPLLVFLGIAAAWTTIQWLPLPAAVVEPLTPTLHSLREDGAELAGVSARSSISVDPPGTLRALTYLLTLSAIAYVAIRLSVSERGRYALLASIGVVAGLTAFVCGVHELSRASALYGLYEPRQGRPPILGPLLNTNHLGCFMAVGAIVCLGLLLYPKQPAARRVVWFMSGVACIAVTVGTYSRGAILGLATGLVVTLAVLIAQRMHQLEREGSKRRRERFFATTLPMGLVVLCGLTLAVYLGADTAMQQLERTSLDELRAPRSKYEAWRNSMDLLADAPLVGVGRGAFEPAFTRVHPASAFFTFSHPENEAVQALTEWGIPVTILLAAIGVWMLLRAWRRWHDGPLAGAALGGLMVAAFQSNFDFGMELLGVAVPVLLLIATLTYVPLAELRTPGLHRARGARVALAAVALLGAIALLTPATTPLVDVHGRLQNEPSRDEVKLAISEHPLDYLGFAALTEQLGRASDDDTVRVLNHALRLHPTHSGLHWITARLLVSTHPRQAESEYSTAIRYSHDPRPIIMEVVARLSPDRAARALPPEIPVRKMVPMLREAGRADVALLWTDYVLSLYGDPRAAEVLYDLALAQKDYAAAERAARRRCQELPVPRCKIDLAKVLSISGQHDEAIDELRGVADWQGNLRDRRAGWLLLCDAHAASGNDAEAQICLRRLEISGLVEPGDVEIMRRMNQWERR